MSLALARLGCSVTAVDIEPRYLALIERQAAAFGVSVNTLATPFGDAEPGKLNDRIIFFEAFPHALDHAEVMPKLREQLSPDGCIVLAGNPSDDHFRPTCPIHRDLASKRKFRNLLW